MKYIKFVTLALVAIVAFSALSAASASAAAPELLNKNKEQVKGATEQKSKGKAILTAGANKVECASFHSTKGAVLSTLSTSYTLLFNECKLGKEPCASEAEEKEGHKESIETFLLLYTLSTNAKGETVEYIVNEETGSFTGKLATFKCGTKTTSTTGCFSASVSPQKKLSTTLTGKTSTKIEEIENRKTGKKEECRGEAFAVKATEEAEAESIFAEEVEVT